MKIIWLPFPTTNKLAVDRSWIVDSIAKSVISRLAGKKIPKVIRVKRNHSIPKTNK